MSGRPRRAGQGWMVRFEGDARDTLRLLDVAADALARLEGELGRLAEERAEAENERRWEEDGSGLDFFRHVVDASDVLARLRQVPQGPEAERFAAGLPAFPDDLGTGVPFDEHPARRQFDGMDCAACRSPRTLVLYFARTGWSFGGADKYEFEVVCLGCGAYSLTQYDDAGM